MKRLKILLQSKIFFLFSLVFLIIYVIFFTKIVSYNSVYMDNDSEFLGKLIDYKIDGDKFSFTIKAKEKLQGSYYFKDLKDKEAFLKNIKLGQTLQVNGTLSKPSKNTIPNTFNYQDYLYSKKIYYLLNAQKITILNNKISINYKIKNYFISRVNSFCETNSYMYAFILGDSGFIDNDVYSDFQKNGVTHLFAVSGMHIGLFVVVINNLLKKLHLKDNSISYFIICFFIFYLFLVGFSASVVRATSFYALLFFNKRFNWNFKSIKLFYFLFLLLLIINPFYIKDIGFIYSFLTSFGLMTFSKKITGNYLMKLFKTSAIAFIFSLPVTLYFNYEFNLLTILNNLLVVPIVSLFLFPFSLITFIFPFLENILKVGFAILEGINTILGSISINIIIGKVSLAFLTFYYIFVFLGHKKKRYYLLIVLLLLVAKFKVYLDSNNYVYYLDVGQGDATFIVSEHRKDIILIDSGGKMEYQKESWQVRNSSFNLADTLTQFMKSLGISKIDLFIATHGDKDHIGYAIDLFKEIKADKIMVNNNKLNNDEKKLLNTGDKQIKNAFKGENVYIKNLNNVVDSNENDSSLVLYTIIGKMNFLIMGDAPKNVEQDIIKRYNNLKIDVLKVGHHGSNTSSDKEFLKKINPKFAIISAGRNNRYNHPSIETIETLEKFRIKYYNTQNSGTVIFQFNERLNNLTFCKP